MRGFLVLYIPILLKSNSYYIRPYIPTTMKFTFLLVFCLCATTRALAQTSTGDCEGSIPLCGGIYTEDSAPPGNGNIFEYTGACNQGNETMSLWYTFTVTQPGDLSFILTPNNSADDYDWGMFEITNGGCAGIVSQDGSSPEVECNSYGVLGLSGPTGVSTANGGSGSSNGPGDLNGPAFNADLPVQVGQTFALVVMNWSNSLEGYTIDFTGSSAEIYDDQQPYILEATTTCSNNQAHIQFSEPIVVSSVDTSDFSLTGPGGDYTCISILPDQPGSTFDTGFTILFNESILVGGTYTLSVSDVSGNVQDACGNQALNAVFEIVFTTPITFDAAIETACNGQGGSLSLSNMQGGTNPFQLLLNGVLQDTLSAENLTPGNYQIIINDALNCAILQNIEIPNHDISILAIPAQDSLSCSSTNVEITGVVVEPTQETSVNWSYQNADGSYSPILSTAYNPTITAAGVYRIIVTDPTSGCTSEAQIEIGESEAGFIDLSQIRFPNVITPNGDSDNDTWRPYLRNSPSLLLPSVLEDYKLTIFDRWGKKVFDSTTGSGNYWSVKDAADGTYYYELYYKITCGKLQEGTKSGQFVVIR